jgi:A/G-specific adenine glycosylase
MEMSRVYDLEGDVTTTTTKRVLWQLAANLVPDSRPGDYNQALMELGQKVCLPQVPQCAACPLIGICLARERGTQLERPVKPPRKRTPHFDVVAGVIWRTSPADNGEFLITRRPLEGMLGGLWEFPGGKVEDSEKFQQALQREIAEELGITIAVEKPLCSIKHAYTHFRITLHCFCARILSGEPQHIGVADHAWVTLADLNRYAFAVTDLQIITALQKALHAGD